MSMMNRGAERPDYPPAASWWTVERSLYAIAMLLGLGLRVWQLGRAPLSPWEASNVWPAWLTAQGLSVADSALPNSPLLYNLHWLTFWLGLQGDAATRWVSALTGAALAVTPWGLRGPLGRRAAVMAAFLFAMDPWLLRFSRLADGAAPALLIGMGALAWLLHVTHTNGDNHGARRTAMAALTGLLVVSGPMGWNMAPVLVLCGWLWRRELARAGFVTRSSFAAMVVAAVLGGTLFGTRPEGLSWLATSLSVWWAQWDGQSAGPLLPAVTGGYGVGWPWLRLIVDAPFAGLMGGTGLVLLWLGSQRRDAWFMTGWLAWGMLLWLAPGRSPLALPVAGLALNLLAAVTVNRLVTARPVEVYWREAGAVALTLAILMVSGTIWATAMGSIAVFDAGLGQAVLVVVALAAAILVAYGVWAGRAAALWIGAAVVMVTLGLFTVRSGLALVREQPTLSPLGWQAVQTHPGVRRLAADIQTLSAHTTGDPTELPVQVQVAATAGLAGGVTTARPDPVLGWYLRDMRRLTWVAEPLIDPESSRPLLVMLSAEARLEEGRDGYIGSDYDVEVYWKPDALAGRNMAISAEESTVARLWPALRQWWRWWLYGEIPDPPPTRSVTVWAPVQVVAAQ